MFCHSDLKDDQPCEYCLNEYHSIMEAMDVQKVRSDYFVTTFHCILSLSLSLSIYLSLSLQKQFGELQQQYSLLYEKLQQERDKTDVRMLLY